MEFSYQFKGKNNNNRKPRCFRASDQVWDTLFAQAESNGVTVSDLIEELVLGLDVWDVHPSDSRKKRFAPKAKILKDLRNI